LRDF
jgi:hypothetical protein